MGWAATRCSGGRAPTATPTGSLLRGTGRAARRRSPWAPRTATARAPGGSISSVSVAVPVTLTRRVWGTSASSAPNVTTISQPVARYTSSTARQNDFQRYDGSMPRSTTRSRSGKRATRTWTGPHDGPGDAVDQLDLWAAGLEVGVGLGVDVRDPFGIAVAGEVAGRERRRRRRRRSNPRTPRPARAGAADRGCPPIRGRRRGRSVPPHHPRWGMPARSRPPPPRPSPAARRSPRR